MSDKEQSHEQQHELSARATRVESRYKTVNSEGGAQRRHDLQCGVRTLRHHTAAVLRLGAPGRARRTASVEPPTAWTPTALARRGTTASRNRKTARGDRRAVHGEPRAKKGALAQTPYRHYTAGEKQEFLDLAGRAESFAPDRSRSEILQDLGLPHSTF